MISVLGKSWFMFCCVEITKEPRISGCQSFYIVFLIGLSKYLLKQYYQVQNKFCVSLILILLRVKSQTFSSII